MSEKKTFPQRFAAAIGSMPNPVKDTKAYQYRYETLPQVLGIVQPALNAQGLYVQQGIRHDAESGFWYLSTIVVDTEDGTAHEMDARPVVFGDDQQRNGSFETYARRYALKTVFGLCGEDEDDDGARTSPKPAQGAKASKTGKEPTKAKKAPHSAPDGLAAAKQRAWAAMKAWGEYHGETAEQVFAGIRKRPDWAETAEFFLGVADELERGMETKEG